MRPRDYMRLARQFLALRPSAGQLANAARFAWHHFTGHRAWRVSHTPVSVGFYITYKCNLSCKYCWNKCINDREFLDREMTLEEFEGFLRHPLIRNAFRVSYVGGEPLTHPRLFDFIEAAHRARKMSMFPTNGLLIHKRLEEFSRSHLHTIQVSLYDEHLDRQVENVRLLREANPGIEVVLSHWVTSETYRSVEDVISISGRFGVDNICIQNFIPPLDHEPTREELDRIIWDDDVEILEYFDDVARRFGKTHRLSLPQPLRRDTRGCFCIEPHTVLFVGKGGVLSPCSTIVPPSEEFGLLDGPEGWNCEGVARMRRDFSSHFPVRPDCRYCYSNSQYMRPFV